MSDEKMATMKQAFAFLNGARKPSIARRLGEFGYGQAEWDEGWEKMRRVRATEYAEIDPTDIPVDVLNRLDAWENVWFPIARVVLERHDAALAAEIFDGLSQTSGIALLPSLTTLHERLSALYDAKDKAKKEASALLKRRGLTQEKLDELAELLKEANTFASKEALDEARRDEEAREAAREAHEAAYQDLRAYLREWSLIARTAITNGNWLRQLGLNPSGRPRRDVQEP